MGKRQIIISFCIIIPNLMIIVYLEDAFYNAVCNTQKI